MNKYLLIFITLLSFLASCSNSAHYATLEQADSLMTKNLDSAYTIIRSINPGELSTKDNAYYSLLLTTSQYKLVQPIVSDSVIDIAVKYYTDHFDQDKLTKALMYKGSVLADLNFNKIALASYKEAEKIADSTDCMTMGLLNFRMGELYQKSYIKNDEHIKRYKQSLNYFHKANHKSFENSARSIIGQLYSTRNFDSAYVYLSQALKTAEKLSDKQQIAHCSFLLSNFYDYHNLHLDQAKDLALTCYHKLDSTNRNNDLITTLSILYAKVGMTDSAQYYAKQLPKPVTTTDTMRYHMMQKEIALANNDYKNAYYHKEISSALADTIIKYSKSEEYYSIDKQFDNTIVNEKAEQLRLGNIIRNYMILAISLLLILVATCWYFLWKRKKRRFYENQRLVDQLQSEILSQQSNAENTLHTNISLISKLNKTIDEKSELENSLKKIVADRMRMLRSLMEIKYRYGDRPEKFLQKFDSITAINKKSCDDCLEIMNIANSLYNNMIDSICENYPNITESDKLLMSLVCLEFSGPEIKSVLNLSTVESVYMSRSRLAKKLGTTSLDTFLRSMKL